jgi:hypothetical protein
MPMSDSMTQPGPRRANYPPPIGPPYRVAVTPPPPPPDAVRPARSVLALVIFAVVLGLVMAVLVAAVVGIAVFAIQNALNG